MLKYRIRSPLLVICFAALFSLVAFCPWSGAQTSDLCSEGAGLDVTISIFSGRPDPTFRINDPATIAKLKDLLEQSPAKEGFRENSVIPSILGYRGLIIRNEVNLPGLPDRIEIYNGNVGMVNGDTHILLDADRRIEKFILEHAAGTGAIDESLYRHIQELDQNR